MCDFLLVSVDAEECEGKVPSRSTAHSRLVSCALQCFVAAIRALLPVFCCSSSPQPREKHACIIVPATNLLWLEVINNTQAMPISSTAQCCMIMSQSRSMYSLDAFQHELSKRSFGMRQGNFNDEFCAHSSMSQPNLQISKSTIIMT
eukprot:1156647-Pelagomonas_calceolata.AAC.3